jgi:hypothetical protein
MMLRLPGVIAVAGWALLVQSAAGTLFCEPWVRPDATGMFDMILVQSTLESEMMTKLPEELQQQYNTALVFVGENRSFSLEFRAKDFINAFFPKIMTTPKMVDDAGSADGQSAEPVEELDWSAGEVGFCLTEGVLHGKEHWMVWRVLAQITGSQFVQMLDYINPWRVEVPFNYQLFRVQNRDGDSKLEDLTSGQGILDCISYLNETLGIQLYGVSKAADIPFSTVHLIVNSFEPAGEDLRGEIVRFYSQAQKVGATPLHRLIQVFHGAGDWKYLHVRTASGEAYYRVDLEYPYLKVTYDQRRDWKGSMPTRELVAQAAGSAASRAAALGLATGSGADAEEKLSLDPGECRVLAGDTGKMVQVMLLLCCMTSLVCKYYKNHGGRTMGEFALDSSKQLLGAAWIHLMNLMCAEGLEAKFQGAGDECEWYWINIVIDCTLGVAVEYILLQVLMNLLQTMAPEQVNDFRTGEYRGYDGGVNLVKYQKQLWMWLLIVTMMKACMLVLMALGHDTFLATAQGVLSPFSSSATSKLMMVMVVTPFFMNSLQLWITDNFIKKQGSHDADNIEMDDTMRIVIDHGDL